MLSRPAPGTFCFLPEESVLTLLLQLSDPIWREPPAGWPRLGGRRRALAPSGRREGASLGGLSGFPCGGGRKGKVKAKCCPELRLCPGLLPQPAPHPTRVCHSGVIPGPGPNPLAPLALSRRLCTNQQFSSAPLTASHRQERNGPSLASSH